MRTCCVEGCNAPAAALGACTTHLGLNGGPRVVPVPLEEKWKQRSRGLSRPEEDFAAKLREVPGRALPVPAGVMPFRTVVSPRKECDRTVKRINRSDTWSRLPGTYRAWSEGSRPFVLWSPEKEVEKEVVASA